MILIALQLQLVRQTLFLLDAGFQSSNTDMVFMQSSVNLLNNDGFKFLIKRKLLVIGIEQQLRVHAAFHGVQMMVMIFEKPVMSNTSFTWEFMLRITNLPLRAITLFCNKRNTRSPCDEM